MIKRRLLGPTMLIACACACGAPEPPCSTDTDCEDGLACNGRESCQAGECRPGAPVDCSAPLVCSEPSGECACPPGYRQEASECLPDHCEIPQAPALSSLPVGTELVFTTSAGYPLQLGLGALGAALPASWQDGARLRLEESSRVFARMRHPPCHEQVFRLDYRVAPGFAPAAGQPGSTAVAADDPAILAWADGYVEPVAYGEEVAESWRTPARALGPASARHDDVVSLGRGGRLVVTFSRPLADGPGYDLVVFENGISDDFLELGRVAVSSNGTDFVEFDCASLTARPVGAFGRVEAVAVGGLAGKYRLGFGTPFDLAVLANKPAVVEGRVDLQAVGWVRISDVVGDGSESDSFGNPIYDPYPTVESAGFDLEAVGALNLAGGS